ncbi:hypothetical protein C8Q74DRAFT_1222360 [Fomes fomentarius]|nr:hypothetical protein C8Q74DRAFT_1222360 [Fomes fomentarius]
MSVETNGVQRLRALRSWRWRGSLQLEELPHLAIEIQLKVYSYLYSSDLLALARTCKKFRAFFLHRSNEPLWHGAHENAGNLPPCPPFMSEPAFMNLLFSTYCQNCGKSRVWKAMWAWFSRYCPKCMIALSYSYNEARDKILSVDQAEIFRSSALFRLFGLYKTQEALVDDGTSHVFRFRKTHVDSFMQALDQLAKPFTDEARSQVIGRQKACKDWHDKWQTARADRFAAKRREHFIEILDRLKEKGWDQEVELLQPWEKVFKAIYPTLWPYRHKRLVQECTAVFRTRFAALQAAILAHYIQLPRTAPMDYHPNHVDLAFMEECRAIADVPTDKSVTQEDFAPLIPELGARWERECKKGLTEAVIAHLPAPLPDDVDVLGLGISVFACMRCTLARARHSPRPHAFYRYPAVLGHPCTHYFSSKNADNENMEVYPTLVTMRPTEEVKGNRYPFSVSQVDLGSTMLSLRNIMETMGLDPLRTTAEELQACSARLRCRWCEVETARRSDHDIGCVSSSSSSERSRTVIATIYSWEAALHHSFCHSPWHWSHDPTPHWVLANTCAANEPEEVLSLMTEGAVWACSLCVRWEDYGDGIKVHLLKKHDIEYSDDCIQDGTIYLHQGKSTLLMRPPVYLENDGGSNV